LGDSHLTENWIAAKPDDWDGRDAIILAHGAGQGMHSPFMSFFHSGLARYGVLSVNFNFDYTNEGRTVPDPQPKLQSRFRGVLLEVVIEHRPKRTFIGGKSMGGRVASYIAADAADIHGLVFLGYPLHPPGKRDQMRDRHLYSLKLPMLFISGTKDPFAERVLLENVVGRIGGHATLVWIEGGDHSLIVKRGSSESWNSALETIASWMRL
jgi:hypothetical protein